jgi:hypothetical protein
MNVSRQARFFFTLLLPIGIAGISASVPADTSLPQGVGAVWDVEQAWRETTPTRERISLNGLWRWQPADTDSQRVPENGWGYFKVPGCWPGITDYMQKDCQAVHADRSWQDTRLAGISAAWHEREITIPATWAGRRIALAAEYVNSYAAVYLDGKRIGELRFPAGELDVTSVCRPGETHNLSMLVVALPLHGVLQSYSDSNAARQVQGSVARRGLCGDVYLVATPAAARLDDVRVNTSVRDRRIDLDVRLLDLVPDARYLLRADVREDNRQVLEFSSQPFQASDTEDGRITFGDNWLPEKLWDTHTPQHQYQVTVSLCDATGNSLDTSHPVRFGFREFWIEGRDFYLNGTRIFLSAVPLDNAQVGAAWANYDGARESLRRLQSFGVNAVYTHNYGCEPGAHLSFAEILRAADDVGMLVALSQPHFSHYDWTMEDADQTNGYARHAAFYVRVGQNHPSVVMYSMNHNATGYAEDMNPDLIDGIHDARSEWSQNNVRRAVRAEAIVRALDPTRVVYHHSSGNLGSMHTSNFYPNWVPIQEMSDWFEHWATEGVKPFFACEYGAPFMWDWAMYRGWYRGSREFGSAVVPWDFCLAEWNAQFLGDQAFQISDQERANLRWEARQFRAGNLWHRWDYPHQLGSRDFDERYPVLAAYLTDNWRAFRTWGVSAISPWEHSVFWKMRPDLDRNQYLALPTDWQHLQRPGLSPDYLEDRYERMDLAYEPDDWLATPAADAMYRNNGPLLAYLAGPADRFTSKDHNFLPGQTVGKQLIVINNSRRTVTAECAWTLDLPEPVADTTRITVPTGVREPIALHFDLPADLQPGTYRLKATVAFSSGQTQEDQFALHVVAPPAARDRAAPPLVPPGARIAVFDPVGHTRQLLTALQLPYQAVDADVPLAEFDVLIIGRAALTADGPAPDVSRVREGLKVIVFEQTAEALEKRLGFRVQEYGLRNVFRRVPDHPYLAGIEAQHLRDWRGAATMVPPRLEYESSDRYNGVPAVRWCGLEVPRLWRCGNRGNVASVLIEKPTCGDFLPIIDGGFSLQYSPLLEYREGAGMVLFCQLDVTGRSESDPAAEQLVRNILSHVTRTPYPVFPSREAIYVGDAIGRRYLEQAGITAGSLEDGLRPDQVLIVGRGGEQTLAEHAAVVQQWLQAGGHLLALEMDDDALNGFLSTTIRTTEREYISGSFQPPAADSLFAGLGPADVHNRDPRALPLVTQGAATLAGGVLARLTGTSAVLCQLAPYSFVRSPQDVPGFDVSDHDASEGRHCAQLTLATVPWAQFGQRITAGTPGKSYTFAVSVKPLDQPATVRLEVERAGRPWDRVVRGEDTQLPPGEWTEVQVSFSVDTPYPEGWSAYVHCGQPETRLLVDAFRMFAERDLRQPGDASDTAAPDNLFANPGFEEPGAEPWFFTWRAEQQNLRKTARRTSLLVTRLLANMGVRGQTPLLARLATPASGVAGEPVVANGDFRLDVDADGMPDGWQFTSSGRQATCVLEQNGPEETPASLQIASREADADQRGSVMLAQSDVPVVAGGWYRISLRAKSPDLNDTRISLALQDTRTWRSLFDYQRFTPREDWREFTFLVQANATATSGTRFQIWHDAPGTLWLAAVRMTPCDPPAQGRWTSGLYLDTPQEWDDPYRFFRW